MSFICTRCQAKYQINETYRLLSPVSYGPCEFCHTTGKCIDFFGKLDLPRDELKDAVNKAIATLDVKYKEMGELIAQIYALQTEREKELREAHDAGWAKIPFDKFITQKKNQEKI